MKRAIGERRREAEERVDGEGFEFGLERKCGSQFLMLKGLVVGLGWEGLGFVGWRRGRRGRWGGSGRGCGGRRRSRTCWWVWGW